MSAPEMFGQAMTRREVLVARNAFEMGLSTAATEFARMISRPAAVRFREIMDLNWPLQKVTRPRMVRDPHMGDYEWAVIGGCLRFRSNTLNDVQAWVTPGRGNGWDLSVPSPDRVALWADLLAHPTEEVDE